MNKRNGGGEGDRTSKKRGGGGGGEEEKGGGTDEVGNARMRLAGEGQQLSIKDMAVMRRMKRGECFYHTDRTYSLMHLMFHGV